MAQRPGAQQADAVTEQGRAGRTRRASPGFGALGDDRLAGDARADEMLPGGMSEARAPRRGLVALNNSPLARRIVLFNMMAIVLMVAGVLALNPFRDSLVLQREQGLITEAELLASVFEAQPDPAADPAGVLARARLGPGVEAQVYDAQGQLVAARMGIPRDPAGAAGKQRTTPISDATGALWQGLRAVLSFGADPHAATPGGVLSARLIPAARAGQTSADITHNPQDGTVFSVAAPIAGPGGVAGVVAMTSAAGEIDQLVRYEREQVLQMFVVALLVSFGLSLVLASTIANPLSDLAAAAEHGRDRDARRMAPGRVRIPDLTDRPDEIGRLSVAMRGMVAALYDRIDSNEQFAADVAHEIKNPLASLRSAVASLGLAKRDDQRLRLMEVIEHDVRRLDRLVTDISNASRLDSELVKEEEEEFNLLRTIAALADYLGQQAARDGVELITDLPQEPIIIRGLEGRLAQVFVNLITNAISFCEEGDAVRVWARKRDNRVLVVVEDTGPGIPEQALTNIFKRFYSERPQGDFGNHSGLGLAISKQIVEAHGGVIWAENIRPTHADITSEPLGARFVVGLPV